MDNQLDNEMKSKKVVPRNNGTEKDTTKKSVQNGKKVPRTPRKQTNKTTTPRKIIAKKVVKDEKRQIEFYKIDTDRDGIFKGFTIKLVELLEFIKSLGFYRYDLENGVSMFVHVNEKIVRIVQQQEITDTLISEIKKSKACSEVSTKGIIEKIYGNFGRYTGRNFYERLTTDKPFEFVQDTQKEAFFCFKNGIVVSTPQGYTLKPYSKFEKHVWKEQIKENDFVLLQDTLDLLQNAEKAKEIEVPFIYEYGNFARYCFLLAGTTERFFSLCSLLGYIIHDFTDYKLKAIVLTDSSLSKRGEANGRSGKSLLFKSLGYIRNIVHILGKDFDPTSKHKYDKAKPNSQVIFIDDLKRKFDVEDLFNDITEGVTIDAKNQQPYKLQTKIIATTNNPLRIEGGSAKDRFSEFETTPFFNKNHTPEKEFNQWFFRDWDSTEWNKYYNFMLFCTSYFLKNGLQEATTINLELRKLVEQTQEEIVTFFDDMIKDGSFTGKQNKKELFNQFRERFSDFQYTLKQRTFTNYVRKYCELSPLYKEFYHPFDSDRNEMRGNEGDYFEFFQLEKTE